MAFSIDVGHIWVARTQLQNAADAGALAAMGALRDTGSYSLATTKAAAVAAQNFAGGEPVALDPGSDIEFGFYNYATRNFSAGFGFGAPGVRVEARRSQGSPAGTS